jgi:isochorismate synthase EntC
LESGALLRTAPGTWFLLKGPFRASDHVPRGQIALYHPDFFPIPPRKYWLPEAFFKLGDAQMEELCELFNNSAPSGTFSWRDADLQSFQESFAAIQARIAKASLKKAVPIVFETSAQRPDPRQMLAMIKHLLKAPASLFIYGFWQNGEGILGATPEVLLRQQGSRLQTMALAGTCPKNDEGRRSLMEDPKERFEHDLVVQDIQASLAAYGKLQTRGPQILELPTLYHLKTDIECELREPTAFSFFEACEKLHPTPALGVSPRSAGFEWLQSLPEQRDRGGFGAPFGLQTGEGEALCLVAIRNLQWDARGSRIGSGCGIVAQSELQQEWRELFMKRQSVKKVLGLQS